VSRLWEEPIGRLELETLWEESRTETEHGPDATAGERRHWVCNRFRQLHPNVDAKALWAWVGDNLGRLIEVEPAGRVNRHVTWGRHNRARGRRYAR